MSDEEPKAKSNSVFPDDLSSGLNAIIEDKKQDEPSAVIKPQEDARQKADTIRTPDISNLVELLSGPNLPTLADINTLFGPDLFKQPGGIGFVVFCHESQTYELLTREYLEALAQYIISQWLNTVQTDERPITILEVGAGNGRLSHFLGEILETQAPGRFSCIATDKGSNKIIPVFPVEELPQKEAVEKYNPQIVISSWMPPKKDFTADWRTVGVDEYILIGEPELCGTEESWGFDNSKHHESDDDLLSQTKKTDSAPICEQEGYEMTYLADLQKFQICRTDWGDSDFGSRHSITTSFKHQSKSP